MFVAQHTPLSYDYVLVAKTVENQEREAFKKQIEYIEELKKKNIKVTVSNHLKTGLSSLRAVCCPRLALSPEQYSFQKIIDDDLVFYGIQAPKEIFEKYRYLLKVSDACNWSSDQNAVPLSTR